MKKQKVVRRKNTVYMSDLIDEAKARDAQLEKEQQAASVDSDLDPTRSRLSQIQENNNKQCATCKKKKQLKAFYFILDSKKKLKKIWPSCKSCMSIKRKKLRNKANRSHIERCFIYYSNYKKPNLRCELCGHRDFDGLTLIYTQTSNTKNIILPSSMYRWLCNHSFPTMKLQLTCYNCAYKQINQSR